MLILLIQALLAGPAFSSDKVDYLLEEDSIQELDSIQNQLYKLDQLKFQLQKVEFHIAKKSNGENVYLKFERVAGAVVLAAVIAGSSSIYFPAGTRAMISANITVRGIKSGVIELNDKDANKILNDLVILKSKIESSKKTYKKNTKYYCKYVTYHELCR